MTNAANKKRRARISRACNECEDMEVLMNRMGALEDSITEHHDKQRKRNNANFFKMAGLFVGVFILFGGMMIDTKSELKNTVTKQELTNYVTTQEMGAFILNEMKVIQRAIVSHNAGLNDSTINNIFESNEWFVNQFMEYNPRGGIDKPDYARILKNHAKKQR